MPLSVSHLSHLKTVVQIELGFQWRGSEFLSSVVSALPAPPATLLGAQ
ncbi:hypothetical protein AALP_AA1G187700 [Arabis alpina]|uniref:Uncharacterized protein n=1 Tax=Arabis alpina TaxID=50452 RepID=A0A087HP41_ARAAL|nr:hypothetical protein AALP_AA1G187700 [Arabis alpina]